jgi:hypothetical protein
MFAISLLAGFGGCLAYTVFPDYSFLRIYQAKTYI